ncbi:sigma-70 family RNA polymerase sigma factor [Streptomyces flaveolus]|uniref:sigma-70 family RNA polymerase sigma factor n=1 Tax=Streptomyces flaveolus TaxID=67297 RepID=UPI0033DDBAB6
MSWMVMGSAGTDTRTEELLAACDGHSQALSAYVRRLVGGDRHKAEDIVQETLLRCWRRFDCGNMSRLRPWLFTVARNLVIDGYRRNTNRPHEVSGTERVDREAAEFDEIDRMLSSLAVADAVRSLSRAHREVLYEIYYLGRTVEGTAQSLGVPIGTVKSRVFYGLRSLRLALQERGMVSLGKGLTERPSSGRRDITSRSMRQG